MKKLILPVLLFLIVSVAAAQSKPAYPAGRHEKAVAAAEEKLRLAMIDANKTELEKLVAENLSYGHSGGHIDNKKEFVEKIVSGQSDFVSIELSVQTISVSGKTAIVRHILKAKTNDGGKLGEVHLRIALVVSQASKQTITQSTQTVTQVQTPPNPDTQTPVIEKSNSPVETTVKQTTPTVTTPPTEKVNTIKISEIVSGTDEIKENGLAEFIEGTEGNRKYLALHRTAPSGTILKVRNEMNNREVFVRVMGKLPETAPNDKLVLKLSKSAYSQLGAIDPRFRVEVTYYK